MPTVCLAADGVVLAANAAFATLCRQPVDALLGCPLAAHAVDSEQVANLLRDAGEGVQGGEQLLALRRPGALAVPVTAAWSAVRAADGSLHYVTVVCAEVSPVLAGVEQAKQQQVFFDALNANTSELAVVVNEEARVMFVSPAVQHLLGWDVDTLLTQDSFSYVHPDDVAIAMETFALVLSDGGTRNVLLRLRTADGDWRWLDTTATNLVATPIAGVVGNLRDVTDRVLAEQRLKESEEKYRAMAAEAERRADQLRYAALHDALTGLSNRALLIDRLEHSLAREGTSTAIVMLDLDQFKSVNDAHGHATGDAVLVAVAERLLAAVLPPHTVARFVGDEFVLLLEEVDMGEAAALAHEVLALLTEPVVLEEGGVPIHVGASIGVATGPVASAADLLRNAGDAMQAAKEAGRCRVRQFDRALGERSERGYALAGELVAALADSQLTLAYQPMIDLTTGVVLGMEALARWTSPTFGEVPPAQFVATAEMSGMALELDRWVVRTAMTQAMTLRAAGAVPPTAYVAINLSARSLADVALEEIICEAAATAGLSADSVELEITESAIMEDAATAIGILTRLRDRGFRIAIDDFGTGYSSLSYLRDLPITTLKIDRSFVAGITEDRDALAIAASIVDLARAVGVHVVAEGIETREQAALLRQLGCGAGQGWLWCRALSPEQISAAGWTAPREPAHELGATAAKPAGQQIRREHGIDRLLAMHSEGASLATIASALNREGYRTPTGQRWHSATVARAITRSAYPTLEDGRSEQ